MPLSTYRYEKLYVYVNNKVVKLTRTAEAGVGVINVSEAAGQVSLRTQTAAGSYVQRNENVEKVSVNAGVSSASNSSSTVTISAEAIAKFQAEEMAAVKNGDGTIPPDEESPRMEASAKNGDGTIPPDPKKTGE
jgi:hypothetical protein